MRTFDSIMGVCDPELGKEVTGIYEALTSHNLKFMKKLVKCDKKTQRKT